MSPLDFFRSLLQIDSKEREREREKTGPLEGPSELLKEVMVSGRAYKANWNCQWSTIWTWETDRNLWGCFESSGVHCFVI